jgi:hypothetical protein
MNLADYISALGTGAIRGASGIADMAGSVISYPFREGYNAANDIYQYVTSDKEKRKELLKKQVEDQRAKGLLGSFGEMFGGVDLATQAANRAGLLNAPKNKTESYLQSIGEAVPGVFIGGGAIPGLARKAITAIGSGAGAQLVGDMAEKIDPGYEVPGRIAGSIIGGAPGIGMGNPAIFQRTIKPNLTDKQIGVMKALEKKPKYAPYFAENIKAEDANLLEDLKTQIAKVSRTKGDTNKEVLELFKKTPEVDTSPVVTFLKSHIAEVEGTAPGTGGESVRYARDMIRRLEKQKSPYALHKLKQEVGMFTKDPNAPSITKDGIARPLYGQISEVLEQASPGYRQIMVRGNEARQASELNTELLNAQARAKGDPAQALKKFSDRVIQKEIKDELDSISPTIGDILTKAENFGIQYAERGGSGAQIAQRAAQTQASSGPFSFLNPLETPNVIATKLVNPLKDTKNFLSITEGQNPYLSPAIPAISAGQANDPEKALSSQGQIPQSVPMEPLDLTPPTFPEIDFEQFRNLQPEKKKAAPGDPFDITFEQFRSLGSSQ